ncbi:hypothetical protein JCM17844_06500 [Iodidimonas gelatinilytica]|uniref:Uncharacterized protein n=2 Tax=Iodidimonas TaxID=2066486 RepID=A0A5A7MPC0_9PROT|nr:MULTISPECIES: hypothetical protein [Iodidimonas]GEQ97013.1 hypothetical protein JCM17844_06500 [Iodidimonas gelatinilytica]GER01745.1 hypothetical protein JCM17845_23680 [Iodidimonas gelatinilytica]GER07857.1 hypothetical protein JCM17843_21670 [Kordiimonadales bacterium JCM 17843]GGO12120.1 hypothetical protein GCM10007972_16690 [Iodidimonas muriae]
MKNTPENTPDPAKQKQERLAKALRDNLRRRKEQARERGSDPVQPPGTGTPD